MWSSRSNRMVMGEWTSKLFPSFASSSVLERELKFWTFMMIKNKYRSTITSPSHSQSTFTKFPCILNSDPFLISLILCNYFHRKIGWETRIVYDLTQQTFKSLSGGPLFAVHLLANSDKKRFLVLDIKIIFFETRINWPDEENEDEAKKYIKFWSRLASFLFA